MDDEEEQSRAVKLGAYGGSVRALISPSSSADDGDAAAEAAAEETMLLWGMQQPAAARPNALVSQAALGVSVDSCGQSLAVAQSPSSLATPGVTGSVVWDSGVVLAKFLEHSVDSGLLALHSRKVIELGSGCGLVGCVAALLGGQVVLTDLPDRLRLLRKNVEDNLGHGNVKGSATVVELVWGDDLDREVIDPLPDFGSDVVYSEGAVADLLTTLKQLSGRDTTIFLAGELRNDAILEYFLEAAMKDFVVGRVDQSQWHPEYQSRRVALHVLVKKQTVSEPNMYEY